MTKLILSILTTLLLCSCSNTTASTTTTTNTESSAPEATFEVTIAPTEETIEEKIVKTRIETGKWVDGQGTDYVAETQYYESGIISYEKITRSNGETNEKYYDEKGNVVTDLYVDKDGNEYVTNYENTYDDSGNLIRDEFIDTYGYTQWRECEYYEDGQYKTITTGQNDLVSLISTFEYDDNGNLIKKTTGSGNEDPNLFYEYVYNENNKLVQEKLTDSVNPYTQTITYEYDEEKNQVFKTTTSVNGENVTQDSRTETYNDEGKITERLVNDSDGSVVLIQWEYDELGNVVKMKSYRDDVMYFESTYTYEYY